MPFYLSDFYIFCSLLLLLKNLTQVNGLNFTLKSVFCTRQCVVTNMVFLMEIFMFCPSIFCYSLGALFACPPSYLSLRLKPRLTFSYSHSFVIASPVIRGISKEKWLLPESNSSLSFCVKKLSFLFFNLRCIKEPCLSKSPDWQTQPVSIFSNRLLCFSKISGSLLNPKRTPRISLKKQGFSITLMSCVTF